MTQLDQIQLLARYNQWMNDKVYEAASQLALEALHRDMGAFFGSVFGTLNHLAVGDTLWLKRFAMHPPGFKSLAPMLDMAAPSALDQPLFASLGDLRTYRAQLDLAIIGLAHELTPAQLGSVLNYTTTKGLKGQKQFQGVLIHLFNHQTHHRGQVTTLFSQLGVDVGATDLLLLLPDVEL
jgi:uncharacterized damage-inducible protein DinB